jgi:hypothetical protein
MLSASGSIIFLAQALLAQALCLCLASFLHKPFLPNVFCPTLDLCQLVVPLAKAFAHVLHQLDVLC